MRQEASDRTRTQGWETGSWQPPTPPVPACPGGSQGVRPRLRASGKPCLRGLCDYMWGLLGTGWELFPSRYSRP